MMYVESAELVDACVGKLTLLLLLKEGSRYSCSRKEQLYSLAPCSLVGPPAGRCKLRSAGSSLLSTIFIWVMGAAPVDGPY